MVSVEKDLLACPLRFTIFPISVILLRRAVGFGFESLYRIVLVLASTCLDDSNCVNVRSLAVSIVHILPGKWMEWHGVWLTLVINRHMV